ncbi:MAG: protein kinase domain-containing protein [Myxococcota bacterium]
MRISAEFLRTARHLVWLLALGTASLAPTASGAGHVLVSDPIAIGELGELPAGIRYWLSGQLESAGVAVNQAPAPADGDVAALLERARSEDAAYAVVPDLRLRTGSLRVGVRLYDPDEANPLASSASVAPLATLGDACEQARDALLGTLGLPAGQGVPPLLGELAAVGRALAAIERGEYARAWHEVGTRLTPTAERMRREILALVEREDVPRTERARVLAAAGDGRSAWALIADDLRLQEKAEVPDRDLLLAAAEVELARNRPRQARALLVRLVELDASDAEAQLAYAELLVTLRKGSEAEAAYAEAARLDPSRATPLVRLGELQVADPQARAATLVRAAEREVARLNLKGAQRLSRKAVQLSPAHAPAAHALRARAHESGGDAPQALSAWREAAEAGGDEAGFWVGIGRAEDALGEPGAEKSYRKALALEPQNGEALAGLGQIALDGGRPDEAIPLLRKAVELAPERPESRRALARALDDGGDSEAALGVLQAAPEGAPADAESLTLQAAILRRAGASDEAIVHMEWAARLDPHDPVIQRELASLYQAAGRALEATGLGSAPAGPSAPRAVTRASSPEAEDGGPQLGMLVSSFANQRPGRRSGSVTFLGVRESSGWRARLRQWLHPLAPDVDRFEASLVRTLDGSFELVAPQLPDSPVFRDQVDRLYEFEQRRSTHADTISGLNDLLGTDAIFVAQVRVGGPVPEEASEVAEACADPRRLELELRMLSGSVDSDVSILQDRECFAGRLSEHMAWNPRAAIAYVLFLVLLVYPVVRGWGMLVVEIKLPPKTKGFLHIKIGNRPEPVRSDGREVKKDGPLRQVLNAVSRYRKNMVGRVTEFRWIPARRREYYVSVRGPLLDATTKEIIGHFIEEQTFRAVKGKAVRLTYDMVPGECAVQVDAMWSGAHARSARVALRDHADSLRYARGGSVFYYLGKGTYTVCVGALDRARERTFEITELDKPVPISIDLSVDEGLQVRNCEEAVEPFLVADFAAAAAALEAAGEDDLAHLMRAAHHRQRGDASAAAAEYQTAGRVEEAAEMLAAGSDHEASGRLFEHAGDFDRAGESYREAGEYEDAARCFLAAYDYDSAIECYEALGDVENVISIHEKTGSYLDAAQLAQHYGNLERALRNLQEVERRDPNYGEACRMMAEVLADRGQLDVAIDRMSQAIEMAGGENADVSLHQRLAELREQSGDVHGALESYETIRRLDPTRAGVDDHIQTLRSEVERTRAANAEPSAATSATALMPGESRYEILEELGRGGMGVVYKARDTRLGRIVALKRLPDNLRDNDVAAELFLREAQAAAALNHRNIVTVYDAGEENGVYCITMELLEGLPLSAIQERRGALSVTDTAALGIQICAGLHYAHGQRIVHRDIKTGNLFVTRDRVVKIMDFGLAKTIEEVRKNSTVIGGTPYYMAPEQAGGERVDNRTDLYAFGVTLFRLLTLTFPFTEGDLPYHHRHSAPPDPREFVAQIPEDMARLILDLLEKDPGARPATAADVAVRLQEIHRTANGRG